MSKQYVITVGDAAVEDFELSDACVQNGGPTAMFSKVVEDAVMSTRRKVVEESVPTPEPISDGDIEAEENEGEQIQSSQLQPVIR